MDYADEYAAVDRDHWWFVGRRKAISRALRRYVPPGSRLLDVGCGTGALTRELAQIYPTIGIDVSQEAVAIAAERGVAVGRYRLGDELPTDFDVVCAFDVLEHVDDDVGFAQDLRASLNPGGWLAFTVPAYRWLWGPMDELGGHRRRYTRASLLRVTHEAGIRTVHVTYFNTFLLPVILLGNLLGLPRRGRELEAPPRWLNGILSAVFSAEALLVPLVRMPFGTSILFIGRAG